MNKVTLVDKKQGIVVVTDGDNVGMSKCHKKDLFDEKFGIKLANARFYEEETFGIISEKIPVYINDDGTLSFTSNGNNETLKFGKQYLCQIDGEKDAFIYTGNNGVDVVSIDKDLFEIEMIKKVRPVHPRYDGLVTVDQRKYVIKETGKRYKKMLKLLKKLLEE